MQKEALLYEKLEGKLAHCFLCAHHCRIADTKFGFCGVRQNLGGILYTHVYAKPIAMHIDPIEKKPLYHFLPGSESFSLATIGCNFHCGFCQNWQISQANIRDGYAIDKNDVLPEQIVSEAKKSACRSISYTYTEPTIFFEYALDIAKLARKDGLYNNFITNGYMTKECLEMIKPYLDAANVDLKSFREGFYHKICKGKLEPVLNSIRLMKKMGIWVEVTTLLIPGENDSDEEVTDIAEFIASIDKNMPWHISAFHPDYKFMDHEPTPVATLKKAEAIGRKAGLNYIYVGNVLGLGNDTPCHSCKKLVIRRDGFSVLENNIKQGKCAYCNTVIPGVFS